MAGIYYVGPFDKTAQQLAELLGAPVQRSFPAAPEAGDLVFLATRAAASASDVLPGANPFSACRTLKQDPQVRVFVLIEPDDRYAAEIARFCLADACVAVGSDGGVGDVSSVHACLDVGRDRASVDDLLSKLERELASDEGRRSSALQRMLEGERQESIVDKLTDPETGLYSGAFAAFKLEEEFKRAMRFHQPLSLLLLDVGREEGMLPPDPAQRTTCLAEVAAVFLNECRDIDVLARFTETVFLFLLPGTGSAGAATVARRMLEELRERTFTGVGALEPFAGLATIPAAGIADRGAFLARAEACLRLARQGRGAGGLCVSCE